MGAEFINELQARMPNLFGHEYVETLGGAARVERQARILPLRYQIEHQVEALRNLIDIGQVDDMKRDRYHERFAILERRPQHFVLRSDRDRGLSVCLTRCAADKQQVDRHRDAGKIGLQLILASRSLTL